MKREREGGTDILLLWRGCYRGVCGDGCESMCGSLCHNKMNRWFCRRERESGDGSM
jgi:hypothetical protein